MQRSGSRFLPVFIVIVVVAIIIVAIISIGRAIFNNSQSTTSQPADNGETALLDTSDNHSVNLTVRGPIVAQENFSSYSIDVSPHGRNMTVYKGYLQDVQKSKDLTNNVPAYTQFVYALDKANMMKGTMPSDDSKNDVRGICATGYVYEYSVRVDGNNVKHLWTSTCNGSKGTLNASATQLNNLFFAQIPDATSLVPFGNNGPNLLSL